MRLEQYMTEAKTLPSTLKEFKSFSEYFIEEMGWEAPKTTINKIKNRPFNYVHYRGWATGGQVDHLYRTPRNDRRPKDMSPQAHERLGTAFKKVFGWNPRAEAMFITPSPVTASMYSRGSSKYLNTYMVFPPKGFKCLWSDLISDLFTDSIIGITDSDSLQYNIKQKYKETGYEDNKTNELMIKADDILLVNIVYYPFYYEKYGDAGYGPCMNDNLIKTIIGQMREMAR